MVLSLPENLVIEKNKLHTSSPWKRILKITLTDSPATILRLTDNTADIIFNGNTYNKFPYAMNPVNSNAEGKLPSVSLRICHVTRYLQTYLNNLNGGLGSIVLARAVHLGNLTETYSSLELQFTVTGCQVTDDYVDWVLSMINPFNRRYPLYVYLADYCPWIFKGRECKYAGAATACNKLLVTCVRYENATNYGGLYSMRPGALRLI
jgi:phage-related protein